MVLFGHAEQVGDDEHRKRCAVLVDELDLPVRLELVDDPVGEPPHELLVLLQALRRDEPHEECPVRRVHWGVERRQLVAERELVAMLLDELADVFAVERHREARERPGHRVARRERLGVVVHGERLVVARDHHDVVMWFALHGAPSPQLVEVGVGVGQEGVVAEEVDVLDVAHSAAPVTLCSMISS